MDLLNPIPMKGPPCVSILVRQSPNGRVGPVVSGQDTAHHILVDLGTECQRDLLGNARTAPAGVPPFHCDDGVDEFLVRSLGAGSTPTRTRKQHPVFSFLQHLVQVQQGGGAQADGGTEDACRPHEQGAQAGDDAIGGPQVGRTLAASAKD